MFNAPDANRNPDGHVAAWAPIGEGHTKNESKRQRPTPRGGREREMTEGA